MLTEIERKNCLSILQLLTNEDVFSLMRTSTNNCVTTKDRSEAEEAILNFTSSLEEFFKRRKINRDVLFNYINNRKWGVPRDRDVNNIRDYVIQKWAEAAPEQNETNNNTQRVPVNSATTPPTQNSTTTPPTQNSATTPLTQNSPTTPPTKVSATTPPKTETTSVLPTFESTFLQAKVEPASNSKKRKSMSSPVKTIHNSHTESTVIHNNIINYTIVNYNLPGASKSQDEIEFESAANFVQWFYSLINSQNPDMGQLPTGFGPQHFTANAQLHLKMLTNGTYVTENHSGSSAIADKLLAFPVADRLLFSPGTTMESMSVRTDAFGRKLIIVCGLVHRTSSCVGVFCQSFGLVVDPLSRGVWKIAVTMLSMKEGVATSVPSLVNSDEALAIGNQTSSLLSSHL